MFTVHYCHYSKQSDHFGDCCTYKFDTWAKVLEYITRWHVEVSEGPMDIVDLEIVKDGDTRPYYVRVERGNLRSGSKTFQTEGWKAPVNIVYGDN